MNFRFFIFIFVSGVLWLSAPRVLAETEHVAMPLMGSPAQYYKEALEAEARNDWADASLALRRAVTLDPQFFQAQEKLKEVLAKIGVPFQVTWKTKLAAHCSSDLLVLLGSLLAWSAAFVGLGFFFKKVLSKNSLTKKKLFFYGGLIGLFFFLGLVTMGTGIVIDPRNQAHATMIVLPPYDVKTSVGDHQDRPATTALRTVPVENATVLAQLPTGSLLRLKSRHGVWSYVQMESGATGWIASSALQPLVPSHRFAME